MKRSIRLSRALIASAIIATFVIMRVSLCASADDPDFDEVRQFGLGNEDTQSLAVGDMDGDGDLDLVAGENPSMVYFNDGEGRFPIAYELVRHNGFSAAAIAVGDLDADGDLDIVEINRYYLGAPVHNWVYLNDGAGSFTQKRQLGPVSDMGCAVALGDVDSDGDFDIVLGRENELSLVYLNDGAANFSDSHSFGTTPAETTGIALGDMDADGDLDIITANRYDSSYVYLNNGTGVFIDRRVLDYSAGPGGIAVADMDNDSDLDVIAAGAGTVSLNDGHANFLNHTSFGGASSVAVGDLDGDGDLDVVAGGDGQDSLYLNDGSAAFLSSIKFGTGSDNTHAVEVGDVDGDGSLDIVSANWGQSVVYLNDGAASAPFEARSGPAGFLTYSLALGDVDRDHDLDIVLYDDLDRQNTVHLNDGAAGFPEAHDLATGTSSINGQAFGDIEGDGDLDIVAAAFGQDTIYLNDGRGNFTATRHFGASQDISNAVALGDMDDDSDIDIVVGNEGNYEVVYLNDGSGSFPVWRKFGESIGPWLDDTYSVAVGDLDGDGDLDIVAGNDRDSPNYVYLNDGAANFPTMRSFGPGWDETRAVALGDMDGDGDLDIVAGNERQQNLVYLNDGAANFEVACGFGTGSDATRSLALGDLNGDNRLDIVVGNYMQENAVYLNDGELGFRSARTFSLDDTDITSVLSVGDMDGDGDPDIVAANAFGANAVYLNTAGDGGHFQNNPPDVTVLHPGSPNATFQSTPLIHDSRFISITYTLSDSEGDSVRFVRGWYSINGGGQWHPATAAAGSSTTDLPPGAHSFVWDTFASGFLGASDEVGFRIEAFTDFQPRPRSVPGPYQRPYASATTFPFRVRGTQVRVMEGDQPVKDALVYRQPAGSSATAQVITSLAGEPFKTDGQGYLQGRGTINVGDRLFALAPITTTSAYTLYHTNALPTSTGLDGFTVSAPGIQTLTVSAAHPLVLFNLDVSLEWDPRNDAQYLTQLNYDLQRASEFLFDWTNGQAAIGQYRIYQDRDFWQDAHIRIYATNRLRPSAVQGGVVSQAYTETLPAKTIVYYPGQLFMGATWNRYGNAGSNLDEDWPRTLAHELGHYVLFLNDNYLGKNVQGQVIPVDGCSGAMADPYRDDAAQGYGEFHLAADWLPACENTLSHLDTGRSDWTTITTFYPELEGSATNPGPSTLPLALTQMHYKEPPDPPATLKAPIFFLTQDGQRVQPGSTARAMLYRGGWATDLGRPTLDQLLARGAQVGDRICLYEPGAGRLGCESVTLGDEQIAIVSQPDWRPDIQVSPVTSRTHILNVTNVPAGLSLKARLYPLDFEAGQAITLSLSSATYTGTFQQADPTFEGYVQVWVEEPEPRREALVDFTIGGNPGHQRTGGTGKRSDGGHQRTGGTPVMSADGQVILFAPDLTLETEWFYTLQATSATVQPPPWATLVGQAYRLSATENAPDLAGSSLSFSYLGAEVPPGEEEWLKLYFHDGTKWTQLATSLDAYHNLASAPVQGPGVYALMSSIGISLQGPGWNLFGWPLPARPVVQALQSIDGFFSTVYGYEPEDASDPYDPWKMYDPSLPSYANDLTHFKHAYGYWINISSTAPITWWVKGGTAGAAQGVEAMPMLPASYYGPVLAGTGFSPQPGMLVTARIDGKVCGQTRTLTYDSQIVYAINVFADAPGSMAGCGTTGRTVTFEVGSARTVTTAIWDTSRVWPRDLNIASSSKGLYLPLIFRGQ